MANLIIVKKYFRKTEAEIAKGLLLENGIESIILSDDLGGFRPHLSMGNVKLLVKQDDYEKASELLNSIANHNDIGDNIFEESEQTAEEALIYAVKDNAFEPAKLLLEHGANPNATDPEGKTALEHAKKNNNKEIIDLLEKYGAK